jgi:hypothetical protein
MVGKASKDCAIEGSKAQWYSRLLVDDWVRSAFYAVQSAREHHPWPSLAGFDSWMLTTFALLTSRLPEADLERLGRRLQFSRPNLNHLHDARTAISFLPDLCYEQLPSVVVRLLSRWTRSAGWRPGPLRRMRWRASRSPGCTGMALDRRRERADIQAMTGLNRDRSTAWCWGG